MSSLEAQTEVGATSESSHQRSAKIVSLITAVPLAVWFCAQSLLGARSHRLLPRLDLAIRDKASGLKTLLSMC